MPFVPSFLDSRDPERRNAPLKRLAAFVEGLSSGDRFIAGVLALFLVFSSVYALSGVRDLLLVEVPSHGGSLEEGVVGAPRFVNPLLALSDADRDVTALVYAGLMGTNGEGDLVPVLAESYEISPDGHTYTFTLRPDARFSDGVAVTAEDVAFTVLKAKDPALKSPEFANWVGVSVNAVTSDTVEFHLDRAYAPFLENTTLGILPKHLWEQETSEEFPFSNLMTMPVGAGPYTIESVSRDDRTGIIESYELRASPDYALGEPFVTHLTLAFFPEAADLASALRNGSIDSAYGTPSDGARSSSYSRVFGVFFNSSQNPLFARKEVREALSKAIDRTKISDETLGGYATPIMGPVPPGSGITPTPVPNGATRLSDAAAVLEDAGWHYDETARAWVLDGNIVLTATLKTSNVPELKAVASAVKEDWESFGVPTAVELYEPGDLTQNVIRPRKYEALLFGMVIGRDRDLYAFWDSAERNDPGLNIALYANSRVDDLLEQMRTTNEPEVVASSLQEVNDTIAADYPAAFVYAPRFLYALPDRLRGVALPQIASPSDRFAAVEDWYLYTEKVWPAFAERR